MNSLKTLALACASALVIAATFASASSAAEFHSDSTNTTYTGASEGASVIDAAGGTLSCPAATVEGTSTSKTTSALTFSANYNPSGIKCSFLFFNVTVNMNGCDFVFNANGTVDIAGKSCNGITWSGAGCTVVMHPQTGLNKVTYTNIGSGTTGEITVTPSITSIKYSSSGFCPTNGTNLTDGNYTSGPLLLTGETTGTKTHTGIWWG